MTTTVKDAIDESIHRNTVVHIDEPTADDIEDLTVECNDSVENGLVVEFWGSDEDGDNWRVHCARPGAVEEE